MTPPPSLILSLTHAHTHVFHSPLYYHSPETVSISHLLPSACIQPSVVFLFTKNFGPSSPSSVKFKTERNVGPGISRHSTLNLDEDFCKRHLFKPEGRSLSCQRFVFCHRKPSDLRSVRVVVSLEHHRLRCLCPINFKTEKNNEEKQTTKLSLAVYSVSPSRDYE